MSRRFGMALPPPATSEKLKDMTVFLLKESHFILWAPSPSSSWRNPIPPNGFSIPLQVIDARWVR